MLSDIESIRIAETYYQDVYLKHLPIPHFKMPEVTIEMPVEVKQVNPPAKGVTNSTMMSKMRVRVKDDLTRYLTAAFRALKEEPALSGNLTLRALSTRKAVTLASMKNDTLATKIKASSTNITATVFRDKDYIDVNTSPIRLTELADAMEDMLYTELARDYKEFVSQKNGELDKDAMRNILANTRQLFMNSVTFILREGETVLDIEGSTEKLAQAGRDSLLTKIKVTVREQDYEWTIDERSDGSGFEKRSLTIE